MFHNWMGGGMWYGWIFWVAIIALIVFLIIRFTNQKQNTRNISTGESSLDLLKKRYAKGDISKEEFERMKKDLT